jgi:dehydrogenase/reductase SDR family protein 7B
LTFDDKKVWITGASSGIGAAVARELAERGAHLVLSARRVAELRKVQEDCQKHTVRVELLPLDLTDQGHLRHAATQGLARFGPVDILIHCAGVSQRSLACETIAEVDRAIMELNYFGTVELTRVVLPSMLARGSGHLVVVTSVAGKVGSPLRSSYSASKHALHGYFDCLRAEVFASGLHVTTVCPGYIDTEITRHSFVGNGERYGRVDALLSRGMPVQECARRIVDGVARRRPEFVVSRAKERAAVTLRRFLPGLFFRIVRNHIPS